MMLPALKSSKLIFLKMSICFLGLLFSSLSYADEDDDPSLFQTIYQMRHILTLGYGRTVTNNIGRTSQFTITDPITDQFYDYRPNRNTQNSEIYNASLMFEFTLKPLWLMQLGGGFTQNREFTVNGVLKQGADDQSADTYKYSYHIITRQFYAVTKVLYQYKSIFYPYLTAGLGAAYNNANHFTSTGSSLISYSRVYRANNDTALTYFFGFGMDIDVADHLRAGLGYRYTDLGRASLGSGSVNSIPVTGTLTEKSMHAHEIIAEVSLLF
jgi:opacity protein-like surface antigen